MEYNKEKLKKYINDNGNYKKTAYQRITQSLSEEKLTNIFVEGYSNVNNFLETKLLTNGILNDCKSIKLKKLFSNATMEIILFTLIYKKYFDSIKKEDDKRKFDQNDKNNLLEYVDKIYQEDVTKLSEEEQENKDLETAIEESLEEQKAKEQEAKEQENKDLETAIAVSLTDNVSTDKLEEQEIMKNDLEKLLIVKGLDSNSSIEELIDKLPMDDETLSLFTELFKGY